MNYSFISSEIVNFFRFYGHCYAQINPLFEQSVPKIEQFLLSKYESSIDVNCALDEPVFECKTLASLWNFLSDIYTKSIGFEYNHICDQEKISWLTKKIENVKIEFSNVQKCKLLEKILEAEQFETFCDQVFPLQKRFSLSGAESVVIALNFLVFLSNQMNIEQIVFGMAHRGRLNIMANVFKKPFSAIFESFLGKNTSNSKIIGDVKYHDGCSFEYFENFDFSNTFDNFFENLITNFPEIFESEKQNNLNNQKNLRKTNLLLLPNCSHLESIDPIVLGFCKGSQLSSLPILIHGDSSVSGQGIVSETLNLGKLDNFSAKGTIHIVINNQIGYTTLPKSSYSGKYCTDIAKSTSAAIFHVNGNDPIAIARAVLLAFFYREHWQEDAWIDIICFRRKGHNESDDPNPTSPNLYKKINSQKPISLLFSQSLESESICQANQSIEKYKQSLLYNWNIVQTKSPEEENFRGSENSDNLKNSEKFKESLESKDSEKFKESKDSENSCEFEQFEKSEQSGELKCSESKFTGILKEEIYEIVEKITKIPENFIVHKQIQNQIKKRSQLIQKNEIDWSFAEAIAIASILRDGLFVRFCGQDSQRGTFSQRHGIWHNTNNLSENNPSEYSPFDSFGNGQFSLVNSPLSEAAVLGFEYGYSLANPNSLVVWEAQFGDFANNAQTVIDQYIVSGEKKWGNRVRLILLLPHGYDGQGHDHSSARIERFLQMCADNNMEIYNPSTPAQYFHLLRYQAKRQEIRPIIIFTPKSLLGNENCHSQISDISEETKFLPFISDSQNNFKISQGKNDCSILSDKNDCKNSLNENLLDVIPLQKKYIRSTKAIFCSGKIFYELKNAKEENKIENIEIFRIEQLYPLELPKISPDVKKIYWVQEEPKNMGAWNYIRNELKEHFNLPVSYIGRPNYAPQADGNSHTHNLIQKEIIQKILELGNHCEKA